ncbi:Bifunctional purine biosynthesis protein PurH [Anaplasma phagocytophilum]|uniref:Bifunctional purine biosynthesis protein PurH n=2 Tax=Anaplasma phagocytophilum TaxID=948 RepID=A0AA45UT37_ANAPH|nr:Bifunctional purine biosynthesis protein PurH [Anaplasma phagocytophilum]
MDMQKTKVALLSVTDKEGVVELARFLVENSFRILATKNTNLVLRDSGIESTEVSEYTEYDEIMGGRVKTLHPKIFAGILCNRGSHMQEGERLGIDNIDLLVVNLYPFAQCVARADATEHDIIENIDIGGVALLRAGAKNFQHVTVVLSAQDYDELKGEIENNGGNTSLEYRKKMAARAFALTAAYDARVHSWLLCDKQDEVLPSEIVIHGKKVQDLRIGENPHQKAALYCVGSYGDALPIEQIHGKDLSYNNIVDIESAIKIVADFDVPAVSVIKHGNPCGVAISSEGIDDAYEKAISCDPRSSFGGIIALNKAMTMDIARKVMSIFIEAVVAPDFDDGVIDTLTAKKNMRIMRYKPYTPDRLVVKSTLSGGLLVQECDRSVVNISDFKLATEVSASPEVLNDLLFAWRVCKYVRSNAIVIARDGRAIGVGAGQMSRVDSVEIAIRKAGNCAGAVLASDAFFPFADSIQHAVSAGIAAIVQPGGSLRDQEVIDAANASGIPMYFTGVRGFCH